MTNIYDGVATRYLFPGITVTGANQTRFILGPKGKEGLLWDYGCQQITTTFAGGTNTPQIEVGKNGTLNAYGLLFDFGTAATTRGCMSIRTEYADSASIGLGVAVALATAGQGFATFMPPTTRNLPANTVIFVTLISATGGGAAGAGDFFVDIKWAE